MYKVDMIKGQIWRNKRNNQIERLQQVGVSLAVTTHYMKLKFSEPLHVDHLEKATQEEVDAYLQGQRGFEKTGLPLLPTQAGV